MTVGAEDDDYSMNLLGLARAVSELSTSALIVETIEDVEPLDVQFGVIEPLTVPLALRAALFGQPDVIEGRAILPLHSYAVLDAAKIPGLPEMLETSGLDHACLFQGKAAEDYGDVAPWIIRLEERHSFTRGLFTQGNAPWDMWNKEPGIFLRAQGSLNDLRRHLRRFTRVRDNRAEAVGTTWVYLRFWEPTLLMALALLPEAEEPFWSIFASDTAVVVVDPFLCRAQMIRFPARRTAERRSFLVDEAIRVAMREQRIENFARRLGREFLEDRTEADRHQILEDVRRALRQGLDLRMTETRHLARFVRLALTAEATDSGWLMRPDVAALLAEGHGPGRLLPELEHRVRILSVTGVRA